MHFSAKIRALWGIKHRTSASLITKSNGLAKSMVKKVISLLRIYCFDDLNLELKLPIIEYSIRRHHKVGYSYALIKFCLVETCQ